MQFNELLDVFKKTMLALPEKERILFESIKYDFKEQANKSQIHMTAFIIASVELIHENSPIKGDTETS
jgi:hypothetical protein